MIRNFFITTAVGLAVAGVGFANQSNKIVIPATRTASNNGQQMFTSYCAPCHGVDGKGRGPAGSVMNPKPTDLTQLTRKNHGKYPDTHVVSILEFGTEVSAHGSAKMPVWGPILGTMNRANLQDKQLRISNLARYLETIQQP